MQVPCKQLGPEDMAVVTGNLLTTFLAISAVSHGEGHFLLGRTGICNIAHLVHSRKGQHAPLTRRLPTLRRTLPILTNRAGKPATIPPRIMTPFGLQITRRRVHMLHGDDLHVRRGGGMHVGWEIAPGR